MLWVINEHSKQMLKYMDMKIYTKFMLKMLVNLDLPAILVVCFLAGPVNHGIFILSFLTDNCPKTIRGTCKSTLGDQTNVQTHNLTITVSP